MNCPPGPDEPGEPLAEYRAALLALPELDAETEFVVTDRRVLLEPLDEERRERLAAAGHDPAAYRGVAGYVVRGTAQSGKRVVWAEPETTISAHIPRRDRDVPVVHALQGRIVEDWPRSLTLTTLTKAFRLVRRQFNADPQRYPGPSSTLEWIERNV